MTGEMLKPENADMGEEYWRGKVGTWGSILGDESYLIRPNYPEFFEIRDKARKIGFKDASVNPFDVYRGPYVEVKGIGNKVTTNPYESGLSLKIAGIIGSCQIWRAEEQGLFSLDCGRLNKKFFGTNEPFTGDKNTIIDKLKDLKPKLLK